MFEEKVTQCLDGTVQILNHMVGTSGESLTERFIKSDKVQDFIHNKAESARFDLSQREIKTAILSTGLTSDPLVGPQHYPIASGAERRLFIRDLLPTVQTTQGMAAIPQENVFTNSAGVQVGGSPESFQNVDLGESGISFTLSQTIVRTLGHWQKVSKQCFDDSEVLGAWLGNRLLYGLRIYEEGQLLSGTGNNGQLYGLIPQATSYTVQSPQLTNELDIIADCIRQVQEADFYPSAVVVHPADWYSIVVRKQGTSADTFVLGSPLEQTSPRIFGVPVVISNSISSGTCLVADLQRAAILTDRENASIEVSYQNNEDFRANACTVRALERTALTVVNSLALVTASL